MRLQQKLDAFKAEFLRTAPAGPRYAKGEPFSAQHVVTEEGKKLLFGQTAASVARN